MVDGAELRPLGALATGPVGGSFSDTFGVPGRHSLAVLLMDVSDTTGVSTLAVSSLNVSAVRVPASCAMLLLGLGLPGGARRCG